MSIVKISKLRKSYKDLVAVKDLDLEIQEGDVYGLLGLNGAGKSTLLMCLINILGYDNGEILFEDKYTHKEWTKNIGYIPQELAIYPELTSYENVAFFASLYGFKGKELDRRVNEAIEFVELTDVKDKKSAEFSGGMKRRLNLACAIAHSPKLIIMDEPTVGIDPQSRNRILENVRELSKRNVTVIYTTHYMEEVEAICNQISIIDHGEIIASGTKDEIKKSIGSSTSFIMKADNHSGNREELLKKLQKIEGIEEIGDLPEASESNGNWSCRIKCRNENLLNSIVGEASANEVIVKSLNQEKMSLEDIFLELTGREVRDNQG